MNSIIKWIAIGSAMLVLPSAATADVTWRVNGVFDDGTALTGTFAINPYGFLDTAALTTAAQAPFAGFTYTPANSSTGTTPTAIDFQPGYTSDLHLVFAANLSHPGTNNIVSGYECIGSYSCFQAAGTVRTLVSGVATVPEPASWALLTLGFAVTGGVLRARRAIRAAAEPVPSPGV
jgi:hypothetical protein